MFLRLECHDVFLYVSSEYAGILFPLLNMKRALTLRFLAAGVPSFFHLLKLALSNIYLPLSQESPIATEAGEFFLIVVVGKGMEDLLRLRHGKESIPPPMICLSYYWMLRPFC